MKLADARNMVILGWAIGVCIDPLVAQGLPDSGLAFTKTATVLVDIGEKGSFDSCQAKYPSILRVGDRWWMWYNGRTDDCFTGSIGLATSPDGLTWTKHDGGRPVFEHGAPGTFDATKIDHPAVLRFEGAFHMWYTAGDGESRYTIGYATSADGIVWKRENGARAVFGPGGKGSFDDHVVLHPAVVRDRSGKLHMWYNGVGLQKTFRVGHATSRDGITWRRENGGDPVLEPAVVGGVREEYVYNVHVMLDDDVLQMWYSAWTEKADTVPGHNVLVHARSPDGTHWKRDAAPTLCSGQPDSLDEYACFACFVVPRDDELWMYYSMADASKTYRVGLAQHIPKRRAGAKE